MQRELSARSTDPDGDATTLKKGSVKGLFVGAQALAMLLGLAGIAMPVKAQTFDVLYSFTGAPDGARPTQADLLDVNGVLYGVTPVGGAYGYGTIFKLTGERRETVLYSFTGGVDGAYPNAGLVRDAKGNFYGTTQNGGDLSCSSFGLAGCGVVYQLSSGGTETAIQAFTGTDGDGEVPQGVILDRAGNLYGTTFFGGNNQTCLFGSLGCGVVYRLKHGDSGWSENILYAFTGSKDGADPSGLLTRDSAGNIFGTAFSGGNLAGCPGIGCGVVFKLDTSGKETPLYTFTGGSDGSGPNGSLVMDAKGNLYGTTSAGGDLSCSTPFQTGCGVVFQVTPAGKERVIHSFKGGPDGAFPDYGLVQDAGGNFYSTTVYGGVSNLGTAFEVTATGKEKVLHSFSGLGDGGYPTSGFVMDGKGNLFSNTSQGGDLSCNPSYGCGTVFRLFP